MFTIIIDKFFRKMKLDRESFDFKYVSGEIMSNQSLAKDYPTVFTIQGTFFCLVFAMFCARLFICALWSPAGKGLTSWLSFVVSSVSLSLSHCYPGSGVILDCIDS